MNTKQALAEARKRWGKNAAVQDRKSKSSPQMREQARAALKLLREQSQTKEQKMANRKELDRLQSESFHYRYQIGKLDGVGGFTFFSVKACGDTWEDTFAAATAKNNEGTAYA